MSIISDLLNNLKLASKDAEDAEDCLNCKAYAYVMRQAYEMIEVLSSKLASANMERSTAYYNDGWIPVDSGKLPEEKENPVTRNWYVYPVMVRFEEVTDIRYYSYGNGHWYHGPGIMDKYVTHWMDIKPYQPKGEK